MLRPECHLVSAGLTLHVSSNSMRRGARGRQEIQIESESGASGGEIDLNVAEIGFYLGYPGWFVVQKEFPAEEAMMTPNTWKVINLEEDKRQNKRRALGRQK